MSDLEALRRALGLQAAACAHFGSPFCASLLELARDALQAEPGLADLFSPWKTAPTRDILTDAAPIRFLGALHDLVLAGEAPALAGAYPARGRAGEPDRAWTEAMAALPRHFARLAAFMAVEPQTNEVRRAACLLPGFLTVAAETGLDLSCFELGASAGLIQLWDRYAYRLGKDAAWGPVDSPLILDTDWRGALPPLDARIRVRERAACDRQPIDLGNGESRRRLMAYIWPDQTDRMARLGVAIDLAVAAGVVVDRADAIPWAAKRARPRDGSATVLYHSVLWQYLPADRQDVLAAGIEALGASATRRAPFAWLRMEPAATDMARMELRLTLWPDRRDGLLAEIHPHGAWVDWRGWPQAD